eukprot:jgi/Mesen1/8197/ME000442S07476
MGGLGEGGTDDVCVRACLPCLHACVWVDGRDCGTVAVVAQALNQVGAGPFSRALCVTTAADVPAAPSALIAVASGPSSVHLQWEAPERENGSEVRAYMVQMLRAGPASLPLAYLRNGLSSASSLGHQASPEGVHIARNSSMQEVTTAGTSGGRQVATRCASANEMLWGLGSASPPYSMSQSGSNSSLASFPPSAMSPPAPQAAGGGKPGGAPGKAGRKKRLNGARSASMTNVPSAASAAAPGGGLIRSSSVPSDAWEDVYCGPALECEVAGLDSGCRYFFRVMARNAVGASACCPKVVAATAPGPPPTPAAPLVVATTSTTALLHWAAAAASVAAMAPADLAAQPSLQRSFHLLVDDGEGGPDHQAYEGPALSFTLQHLAPGRVYRCRLQVASAEGVSAPSAPCIVSPPKPPPLSTPALHVALRGTASASLEWGPALSHASHSGSHGQSSHAESRRASSQPGGRSGRGSTAGGSGAGRPPAAAAAAAAGGGGGGSSVTSMADAGPGSSRQRRGTGEPRQSTGDAGSSGWENAQGGGYLHDVMSAAAGGARSASASTSGGSTFRVIYEGPLSRYEAGPLPAGRAYKFRVRAEGSPELGGNSAWSNTETLLVAAPPGGTWRGVTAVVSGVQGGVAAANGSVLAWTRGAATSSLALCRRHLALSNNLSFRRALAVGGTVCTIAVAFATMSV